MTYKDLELLEQLESGYHLEPKEIERVTVILRYLKLQLDNLTVKKPL